MIKQILISTQFPGFHHWPSAPEKYEYLSNVHRHMFHVKAALTVTHNNRDIEFIDLRDRITRHVHSWDINHQDESVDWSCEHIAELLLLEFDLDWCEVWEDNENGARIESDQQSNSDSSSSLMKREYVFSGIEAEGPPSIRNRRTLFIPKQKISTSTGPNATTLWQIKQRQNYPLYIGAGGYPIDEEVSWNDVAELLRENMDLATHPHIIEFESLEFLINFDKLKDLQFYKIHPLILVFRNPENVPNGVLEVHSKKAWNPFKVTKFFHKYIHNGTIYWHNLISGELHATSLKDPLFEKDYKI